MPPRNTTAYDSASAIQRQLVGRRRAGEIPDLLWLLEHPPTVTWGRSGGEENLLQSPEELQRRGVTVSSCDRGGNVTYHEPGQLVGYLIVDLRGAGDRDLPLFLRRIESGVIALLATFGLEGTTVQERTGVWLRGGGTERKIAAMGIRAQGWVSSHGFALNVENSMEGFEWILPCGISDAGVTSLERELNPGALPPWDVLCAGVHRELEASLGRRLELLLGDDVERFLVNPKPPNSG